MEATEVQLRVLGKEGAVNKLSGQSQGASRQNYQFKSKPSSLSLSSQNSRVKSEVTPKPSQSHHGKHSQQEYGWKSWKPCFRCGRRHNPDRCPAVNWECFKCHRKGHTSQVCRRKDVKVLEVESQEDEPVTEVEEEMNIGLIFCLNNIEKPLKVNLNVEGRWLEFEVDSGACVSVVHESDVKSLFSNLEMYPISYDLKVVTGESVITVGEIDVNVWHKNRYHYLPLVVLRCNKKCKPLLGRNWLNILCPRSRDALNLDTCNNEESQIQS